MQSHDHSSIEGDDSRYCLSEDTHTGAQDTQTIEITHEDVASMTDTHTQVASLKDGGKSEIYSTNTTTQMADIKKLKQELEQLKNNNLQLSQQAKKYKIELEIEKE